jgi:hypothetical protein
MVTTSLGDRAPADSPDDDHLADSDSCITFPLGLVGWESWKRFVLLMDDEGDELPVAIMQLVDDPDVSIMVTDPSLVCAGYEESVTLSEDDRISSGSGDARVEVSRLLEADELKQLLARSNKDVTFVAAILSNRVYEDVVAAGFATKPTSVFVPTTVAQDQQVAAQQQYQGKAYLHVPVPSGDLLTQGFVAPAAPDQTELDTPPETEMRDVIRGSKPFMGNVNNSISGEVRGPAIQAGYIDNYTHNDSHNHYRGGQHVTGNNNTVAGRDVSINEGRKKKRGNR